MTYKQIEAARETRLWIGQVIVPAAIGVAGLLALPEVRKGVAEITKSTKNKVKNKFKKKGSKKDNVVHIDVLKLK